MRARQVYNWLNIKRWFAMHCLLCRGITGCHAPICQQCIEAFTFIGAGCILCGLPMAAEDTRVCSQCLKATPMFDQCISPLLYEFPVNRVIQSIKYQSRLELINPVSELLAAALVDRYVGRAWPQVVIPVPLHSSRLKKRGYNQALLFTKAVLLRLNTSIPVLVDKLVCRSRNTNPQQGLDIQARRKNIRHAFSLNYVPRWHHVALMDDVLTTGATASEIARLLKQSGVRQVDVWTVARTPESGP